MYVCEGGREGKEREREMRREREKRERGRERDRGERRRGRNGENLATGKNKEDRIRLSGTKCYLKD